MIGEEEQPHDDDQGGTGEAGQRCQDEVEEAKSDQPRKVVGDLQQRAEGTHPSGPEQEHSALLPEQNGQEHGSRRGHEEQPHRREQKTGDCVVADRVRAARGDESVQPPPERRREHGRLQDTEQDRETNERAKSATEINRDRPDELIEDRHERRIVAGEGRHLLESVHRGGPQT